MADDDKWGQKADLSDESDSDGSTDLRAAPMGVFSERSRKAAWAGSHMEEAHTQFHKGAGEAMIKEQFYNTEVGVGYQHKTVKRQKTGAGATKIVDMTGPRDGGKKAAPAQPLESGMSTEEITRLAIESDAVRSFKREIKRLIKSAE
jgi:hypothetical protein